MIFVHWLSSVRLKSSAIEEEHGLSVFDVRALRKIFRSKRGSIRKMEKRAQL